MNGKTTHDSDRVVHNVIAHPGVSLKIHHLKTPGKKKQAQESTIQTSIIQQLCFTLPKPRQSTKTKAFM